MRYIWMIFVGLLVAMVTILPRLGKQKSAQTAAETSLADTTLRPQAAAILWIFNAAFAAGAMEAILTARCASVRSTPSSLEAAFTPDG